MYILLKFSLSLYVCSTVWIHHLDSKKIHGEKARWGLHINATCCFKQILEAAIHNLPSLKLSKNCSRNKDKLISDILLWTRQWWLTSKDLYISAVSRAIDDRDGWRERVRELHAINTTWWWWWWWWYNCNLIQTAHHSKICNREIYLECTELENKQFPV